MLPSTVHPVERGLAVVLVGLLALFAVGTVAGETLPVIQTTGIIAIHLAIVAGFVFPVTILIHTALTRIRTGRSHARQLVTGTALLTVSSLVAGLWQSTNLMGDILLGIAAVGALLLAVFVLSTSDRN